MVEGNRRSTAAMAVLLNKASATPSAYRSLPSRTATELARLIVAQEICRPWACVVFAVVSACPGCGRTKSVFFQALADKIQTYLRLQMRHGASAIWRRKHDRRGDGLRG